MTRTDKEKSNEAELRNTREAMLARKHGLQAQLAELKADKRRQKARARLIATTCFYFGVQAMHKGGLLTPATRRALQAQRRRLLALLGAPLPGSDCVADTFDLMQHGYRTHNQTPDDMVKQSLHKLSKNVAR